MSSSVSREKVSVLILFCSADITTCQVTYGKKILLSLGGSTYSEAGFTTATFFTKANQLWTMFGRPAPGQSTAISKDRPFGAAMVDGFDFDFEKPTTNLVQFAQQLRTNMNADTTRTGRQWLLSVTPQCPFPDANMGSLLNSPLVKTDLVFVQFYNNPSCGLNAFTASSSQTFNFATWDKWAKQTSANKAVKVFLGVPGGPTAAGAGSYKSAGALGPIISFCKTFSSFGGVAMWDASQVFANSGFLTGVKAKL